MMETVSGRVRQLEEANEELRTELREAQELGEERYRHDRDNARQEAEETARQVAEVTAAAKTHTSWRRSAAKDADWPRWSLTLGAYLGAVSGRMLELLTSAESPGQSLDGVGLELGDDVLDAQFYLILTTLLEGNLMEKVETVEHGEVLRLWRLLS